MKLVHSFFALGFLTVAAACSGGSGPTQGGGSSGGSGSGSGNGSGSGSGSGATKDSGVADKGDFGKTCSKNSDCHDVCLFKGSADYGYCSKACESFTDCPTFWDCEDVGNASGKYCTQN